MSAVSNVSVISSGDDSRSREIYSNQKTEQDFTIPLVPRFSRNDRSHETEIEQKLIKALRLAQCDFVFELEKGLDTEIGER